MAEGARLESVYTLIAYRGFALTIDLYIREVQMGIMASQDLPSYSKYFYIRIVVPKELRSAIGKREFESSLKTSDKREAQLRGNRSPGPY